MNDIIAPEFWESRYQQGNTRWDLGQANPAFVDFCRDRLVPPGRTLVLGCGRGYDAILFAGSGFEVVAVDFAPSAIAAAKTNAARAGVELQLLQRDIFDLVPEYRHSFDYAIEHTCFCALPPERRSAYVELVAQLLVPAGELIGVFFTHQRPGGPPFGVTPERLQELFGGKFECLHLDPVPNSVPSREGEEYLGRFRKRMEEDTDVS